MPKEIPKKDIQRITSLIDSMERQIKAADAQSKKPRKRGE